MKIKPLAKSAAPADVKLAHTIVVGGENAGSGKSTTAVHLAVSLMNRGKSVGLFDLDSKRGTCTKFLSERIAWAKQERIDLPVPSSEWMQRADTDLEALSESEKDLFSNVLNDLVQCFDYVIIDCPSDNKALSELSHAISDTLVTPVKTSGSDMGMLASIDSSTKRIKSLGGYSELVWESRKKRAQAKQSSIDWIVMKSFAPQSGRPKRETQALKNLATLSTRLGFRIVPGLSERHLYREMFHRGLTLADLRSVGDRFQLGMSHVAARQEVRCAVEALRLPGLAPRLG